jgi:hypothetical protein
MRRSREEVLLTDVGHALLCGVGAAVGVFGVVLLLVVVRAWPWWWPVLSGVVAGAVTFAAGGVLFSLDSRSWLWQLEERLAVDLDGDHVVGEPVVEQVERAPRFVYVRNVQAEQRRRRSGDFRAFLQGCYNGRGATWRAWRGVELPSGERVTRSTWEQYTERLERAGLGSRPYETAALELDSSYREALETFAEVL